MSEERERLKEEYKQHYRQILEHKKQLAAAERKSRVLKSLQDMDTRPVLETMQDALGAVRERIAMAEARLDVWLENRDDSGTDSSVSAEEVARFEQKQKASQLLSQIKAEMGTIERSLDEKAAALGASKTIADVSGAAERQQRGETRAANLSEPDPVRLPADSVKTIGRNDPA